MALLYHLALDFAVLGTSVYSIGLVNPLGADQFLQQLIDWVNEIINKL